MFDTLKLRFGHQIPTPNKAKFDGNKTNSQFLMPFWAKNKFRSNFYNTSSHNIKVHQIRRLESVGSDFQSSLKFMLQQKWSKQKVKDARKREF